MIRLIIQKIKALLAPQTIKVKTQNGKLFLLHNPPFEFETELYWKGLHQHSWEKQTRQIWSQLAEQSEVILDIGANTGIFSILAKLANSQAKVYAFEPQPNIFSVLQKNAKLNQFDIQCQSLALSNTTGNLPFYNYGKDTFGSRNTTAGSLNQDWRPNHQAKIDVPVSTLDQFIEDNNIPRIDLIKIDVETHEPEVLQGYKKYLFQHRPTVILEVQSEKIGKKISEIFENQGYQFFIIDEQRGQRAVTSLGAEKDNNYLLVPSEKFTKA